MTLSPGRKATWPLPTMPYLPFANLNALAAGGDTELVKLSNGAFERRKAWNFQMFLSFNFEFSIPIGKHVHELKILPPHRRTPFIHVPLNTFGHRRGDERIRDPRPHVARPPLAPVAQGEDVATARVVGMMPAQRRAGGTAVRERRWTF